MKRIVMEELGKWYDSCDGRILFLAGAPRVGKSWLIDNLCKEKQEKYIKISVKHLTCTEAKSAGIVIITDVNDRQCLERAKRIILRIRSENSLKEFKFIIESRIVRDETYLKAFINENYVNFVRVYPLNIREFASEITREKSVDMLDIMRLYLYIGGMPECVCSFLKTGSLTSVRATQNEILRYIKDNCCSKKSKEILNAISLQVKTTDTSFTYRRLGVNAREREYGKDVEYLLSKGVIYRLPRFEENGYRLYMYDVGLMTAMLDIEETLMMKEYDIYKIYNETLVQCFVLQEYMRYKDKGLELFYWHRTRAKARLPLVINHRTEGIIILNLCAGVNYSRSVQSFCERYDIGIIYNIFIDEFYSRLIHKNFVLKKYDSVSLYNIDEIFEKLVINSLS